MPAGRPSVYEKKVKPNLRAIRILRANGSSMEEIADFLGVSRKTLYNHMNEIDELLHTIKEGTNILVDELEAKLYDLARGNICKRKTKTTYNPDGEVKGSEETIEQAEPNLGALIFALTNLQSDKWKNKQDVSITPYDEIDEDMESYET